MGYGAEAGGGYLETNRRRNDMYGRWQTEGLQTDGAQRKQDGERSPWTGDYKNLGTWKRWDLSGRRQAGVTPTSGKPTGATGEGGAFSPDSKEQFGEKSIFNKEKYLPLVYVPIPISHYCCQVMKKAPMKAYQHKNGVVPYLGTLAEESRIRTQAWIRHGCNSFDSKKPSSQPLSFWTEQDILQYLVEYGDEIIQMRRDFFFELNRLPIDQPDMLLVNGRTVNEELELNYSSPIADVYGEIVATDDEGNEYATNSMMCAGCKYKTTGADRTGCVFCGFGFHLEKGETRFQRLARTHPRQYEYCMGGGQWVDNPAYDPAAPEYDGEWKNWNPKKIWVPSKKGLGMKAVFDMVNEIYGKDFYRYE